MSPPPKRFEFFLQNAGMSKLFKQSSNLYESHSHNIKSTGFAKKFNKMFLNQPTKKVMKIEGFSAFLEKNCKNLVNVSSSCLKKQLTTKLSILPSLCIFALPICWEKKIIQIKVLVFLRHCSKPAAKKCCHFTFTV